MQPSVSNFSHLLLVPSSTRFPGGLTDISAELISFRAKGSVQGRHLHLHLRQREARTAGECCNLLFDFSIHQADMVIPPFVQQDLQYLAC
jgi:hypothetical protein